MRRSLYLFSLIFTIGFLSCQQSSNINKDIKTITVSILPQKFIVSQISGEQVKINVLVPEDANHETYEPTAAQMVEVGNSQAYFSLGHLDFENSWLNKLHQSNPEMKIFDTSTGIDLIAAEEHEHGDHTHQSGIDPHIWLSVSAVRIQAENILEGLKVIDSVNGKYYEANYQKFMLTLDSLDAEIHRLFESIPSRSFMIYHPSLGYFARDYQLEQIAIEQEGKDPSPAYMKNLIDLAEAKNISTIFISSQFSKQSALTIAEQIHAKVEEFNPTAPDWINNMKSIAGKLAESTHETK